MNLLNPTAVCLDGGDIGKKYPMYVQVTANTAIPCLPLRNTDNLFNLQFSRCYWDGPNHSFISVLEQTAFEDMLGSWTGLIKVIQSNSDSCGCVLHVAVPSVGMWPGCLWLRLLYLRSESWAPRAGLDFQSPSPLYIFVHIHKIIRLKEENGYGDRECIKRADDAK